MEGTNMAQAGASAAPQTSVTDRPPKGALITGIVLLLLALSSCGVGGLSCVSFASSFADILTGASTVALGETTSLEAESSTGVVASTSVDVVCEAEDENGSRVTFAEPTTGSNGEFTSGSDTFTFVYSFDTNPGSSYQVVCAGSEFSEGQYAVASFPGFGKLGVGFAGFLSGFFLTFLGLIFLIVGLVKRSRWKKRQVGPAAAPPPQPPAPLGGAVATPPPMPPPMPGVVEGPRIEAPAPWMPDTPVLPTPSPPPMPPTQPAPGELH
jgi:hypothetical protein